MGITIDSILSMASGFTLIAMETSNTPMMVLYIPCRKWMNHIVNIVDSINLLVSLQYNECSE